MAGLDSSGAMADFVSRYDLAGFPHAIDPDGGIWAGFGNITRSAFVFVNDDGTVEQTAYGALDEDGLRARIDALLAR